LLGGTVLLWLVAIYPAIRLWGNDMLLLSVVAMGLCLAPTLLTLLWGAWAQEQTPEQQLLMVLGGTGVRLFVVLGVGLGLSLGVAYFQEANLYPFWTWVLVFYLVTLFIEVLILILGRAAKHTGTEGVRAPSGPVELQSPQH
jgi:hypothetical protein